MTTISIDDVKKLADLSALTITDDEADHLRLELGAILEYFEMLEEVDTEGITPTYQVNQLSNVYRDDEIIDYNVSQDDLLKNAPQTQEGQIQVPRVLN